MELQLRAAQIYHDWFRDDDADQNTAADPHEIQRIMQGVQIYPPNAITQFAVAPKPDGVFPIPLPLRVVLKITGPGKTGTEVFTATTQDGPYEGVLAKIKPQRFNRTNGYGGLIVIYAPGGGGPSEAWLHVEGDLNGETIKSNVIHFPWVAKG